MQRLPVGKGFIDFPLVGFPKGLGGLVSMAAKNVSKLGISGIGPISNFLLERFGRPTSRKNDSDSYYRNSRANTKYYYLNQCQKS